MLVDSCFRTTFASKRARVSQALLEHAERHFHPNFPLIQDKLSWETSPLVISEIIGLFGNTLIVDDRYSRQRCKNLWQHVETLSFQKRRTFSGIFIPCSESTQTFAHFEKKDHLQSLNILEVINHDKYGYFNDCKHLFQNTLRQ